MAEQRFTLYQRLQQVFGGGTTRQQVPPNYNIDLIKENMSKKSYKLNKQHSYVTNGIK